jgi:hypothetical protein
LVLALGESTRPAWWKTNFMNETGLRFLERLYPRSSFRAAVHAAGKAACEIHDRAVGRVGVYHLFRLPESLEMDVYSIQSSTDEDFTGNLRSRLGQQDKLLEMLTPLCDGEEFKNNAAGPRRIGTDSDATTVEALGRAAAVYHQAFKLGKPTFPYFAAEQNGICG